MERSLRSARRSTQRHHLPHLVRLGRAGGDGRAATRPRGPEQLHARVDRGALPRPHARDRARHRGRRARPAADRRRAARRRDRAGAGSPRLGGRAQPALHLRPLRHRLVEPLRARGRARRRRGAGAGVQPALHLRRHGARQDAPAAGDRQLRRRAPRPPDRPLRHERDLHERLHQLAPRQAHRGLQAALSHLRRAARRRHPVPRGPRADPGGVLPHVQLALRGRRADRALVRPASRATSPRSRSGCARASSGG